MTYEITPEMINAGVNRFETIMDMACSEYLVEQIYSAMEDARVSLGTGGIVEIVTDDLRELMRRNYEALEMCGQVRP